MMITPNHERRLVAPPPMVSASAISRFGKYKNEEHAAIRQAKVGGSLLDELRRKRDVLRSMEPEQAMSVIEFHQDLTVFEALALAKKEGKLIVPNFVHDRILNETDEKSYFRANYPVRTGTMVIYAAPGKPFGEKVVYGWDYKTRVQFHSMFRPGSEMKMIARLSSSILISTWHCPEKMPII